MALDPANSVNVDEIYSNFDRKITKVKHQAFRKCSDKKRKESSTVSKLLKKSSDAVSEEEKRETDEMLAAEMIKERYNAIENDIEKIKSSKKSQQHQVFALKKLISGRTDTFQPEAIVDPESKELLVNRNEILQKTLEFSSGILQNNNPVEEFREHFEVMKQNHIQRMKKEDDEDDPVNILSREDFDKEIKSLQSKGKHIYKDFLKAGEGFKTYMKPFLKNGI